MDIIETIKYKGYDKKYDNIRYMISYIIFREQIDEILLNFFDIQKIKDGYEFEDASEIYEILEGKNDIFIKLYEEVKKELNGVYELDTAYEMGYIEGIIKYL